MYLGIEIGGTKLQLGLGPGNGTITAHWRETVAPTHGAEGIRRQIRRAVPELLTQANLSPDQLKAVGVGFGGPVDDATRRVVKSHQIDGWDNFPLADWIADLVGVPSALGNDADVAGLGEALYGAGKGLSPIFYITIGSGIGGGLILDGKIYRGCGRGAAEIGHLQIARTRNKGGTEYSTLEALASGWAMQEWARLEMRRSRATWEKVLGDDPELTTEHIARAARAGHDPAWYILSHAWDALAEGIAHMIALLSPRRIVIGGGVSLMGEELLFEPLRERVARRVFKPFADCYDIVPAALGEEVVVHGALGLARQHFSP